MAANAVERLAALVDQAIRARPAASLNQIALYAGVDAGYLSRIRRGRLKSPPSPEILARLAPHLNIPYEVLLEAAGYLTPETQSEDRILFNRARRELSDEEYADILRYVRERLELAELRRRHGRE